MRDVGYFINFVLYLYLGLLFARLVVEWVQAFARSWTPHGPLLVILEVVYSATDPPIKALRRVIPPIRIGNFALDLSFLIVLVGAYVLLRVNEAVFLS